MARGAVRGEASETFRSQLLAIRHISGKGISASTTTIPNDNMLSDWFCTRRSTLAVWTSRCCGPPRWTTTGTAKMQTIVTSCTAR